MDQQFKDRAHAGRALAIALKQYAGKPDTIILALPRGGVPVAYEISKALFLPMDIWLVRKLGVPGHEELAMGAITMDGACHINHNIALSLNISDRHLNQVITKEREELARRNKLYRANNSIPAIKDKTIILVDDGLATGATMLAAIKSLYQAGAARIVAAIPVGAPEACRKIQSVVDDVICLHQPENFYAVGQWYQNFGQTSDEQVIALLEQQTENAA